MILSVLIPLLVGPPLLNEEEDWFYLGKPVRLVAYTVDTDFRGEPGVFVPGQRSGYIRWAEDDFTVSVATPLSTTLYDYKEGVLHREELGGRSKAFEKKMSFSSALFFALEECLLFEVEKTLGPVLKKKESDIAPFTQQWTEGGSGKTRIEYGRSWRAVRKIVQESPAEPGEKRKTITFRVILPGKGPLPSG